MAAFDYSRPLATANRLIERYGQLGAVRSQFHGQPSGPAHRPGLGAPIDHPASFVVLDYEAKDIDGTRILVTDKQVLMAPGTLPIEPSRTDTLVDAAGKSYKILDVQTLKPAETALLYTLQVRA